MSTTGQIEKRRQLLTNECLKILAGKLGFVSMGCRHVDSDDSVLGFGSVAIAVATVANNTFTQSIDGNRAISPTAVRRAFRVVESRRLRRATIVPTLAFG